MPPSQFAPQPSRPPISSPPCLCSTCQMPMLLLHVEPDSRITTGARSSASDVGVQNFGSLSTIKGRMRKQQPNADDETGTCSICGRCYQNRGHNAQPVDDGRRCDHCNVAVVVPTRLRLAKRTGAADAH